MGFGHNAQRSLAADEQVEEVHAWRQAITGRVLGGARQPNRGHGKIDGLAPAEVQDTAIQERDAEGGHMLASRAVTKATRTARVRGDIAAYR